ncbi:hypothetical protein FRB93_012852 [Tulasnella sp. JGI-2019a]|nr:hypothetical protein FRB93_012852 [Tulasnella sp. JGI-2019a]
MVFMECVLCHRALWKLGLHHRDISERNLMYFKEGGKVFGMLNDFDMATMAGEACNKLGTDRDIAAHGSGLAYIRRLQRRNRTALSTQSLGHMASPGRNPCP